MRIRTIKPEFFSSLTIHELPIPARLTFIGMWNYADDEGRERCDERLLKAAIWPLDSEIGPDEVVEHVAAIERVGLASRYEVAGRCYYQIRNWHEHQTISKPRPSALPGEDGIVPEPFQERSSLEGKGTGNREGKGNYSTEFEAFWLEYPLHKGKGAAWKAWLRAIQRASVDAIIAGAKRYAEDPNRKPDFTKYAEGWLNADRWTDAIGEDRNGRDPRRNVMRLAKEMGEG